MFYVGIDISKFKHDCFIVTEAGEVVCDSFSFKTIMKDLQNSCLF